MAVMNGNTHRNEGIERLTVYGSEDCHDTLRMRTHLEDLGVSFRYIDLNHDTMAEDLIRERHDGVARTPVVSFGVEEQEYLTEPAVGDLDLALRRHGFLS